MAEFPNQRDFSAGYGGLVRDDKGEWIVGYYGKIETESSLETELWGIFKGLALLFGKGIRNAKVETDSLVATKLIMEGGAKNNPQSVIIGESKELLEWTNSVLAHTDRDANQCADHLAHFGAEQEEDFVVLDNPPLSIREFMIRDCLGIDSSKTNSDGLLF